MMTAPIDPSNGLSALLELENQARMDPASRTAGVPPQPDATTIRRNRVLYYTVEEGSMSDLEERMYVLSLIRMTKSTTGTSGEWRNWLSSYIWMMIPNCRAGMASMPLLSAVPLPAGYIAALRRMHDNFGLSVRPSTGGDPGTQYQEAHSMEFPVLEDLPELAEDTMMWTQRMTDCANWDSLQAHTSLVLFIMGNSTQFSPDAQGARRENVERITQRRTKAILGKFYIPEAAYILSGDLAFDLESTKLLHSAWVTLPSLRQEVIERLMSISPNESPLSEAIWTTLKLLQYNGMTYIPWICEMLRVFPEMMTPAWAGEMASFQPILRESARRVAAVRPEVRPYWKLIMGDAVDHYPRRGLEGLILCAYLYACTNPEAAADLMRYAFPRSDHPIVRRFREAMRARGMVVVDPNVQI